MKWLRRTLIFIIVIVGILAIGFVVVINLNLKQLGLSNKTIVGEYTFSDLGFDDLSVKTIYKDFRKATKENEVVKNGYDTTTEATKVANLFSFSGIVSGENVDYDAIYNNTISVDDDYLLTIDDTTMAYIFNQSLQSVENSSLNAMQGMKISVEEITFKEDMRIVLSVDITEIKQELKDALPGFLYNWLKLPDKLYVVSYFSVNVSSEGKLVLTHKALLINDEELKCLEPLLSLLIVSANEELPESSVQYFNGIIKTSIETLFDNIGKIGTATTDSNGKINGTITYGNSGYKDGEISIIASFGE